MQIEPSGSLDDGLDVMRMMGCEVVNWRDQACPIVWTVLSFGAIDGSYVDGMVYGRMRALVSGGKKVRQMTPQLI